MQEEILTRLDILAEKLGVAAHEMFAIYMRQAPLEFVDVAANGIILVATIFVLKYALKVFKAAFEKDEDSGMISAGTIVAVASIALVVASFILVDEIQEATKAVLNPEYYALTHIGQLLR